MGMSCWRGPVPLQAQGFSLKEMIALQISAAMPRLAAIISNITSGARRVRNASGCNPKSICSNILPAQAEAKQPNDHWGACRK